MSLTPYKKKRDFRRTPEPEGQVDASREGEARPLRFCVQLHAASKKHYDFRIEIDGTMKSWAVPKGPSLDPLDRRLAVLVEDHPIEYCEFEGIIPPGNYGAGTVMIWDEGFCQARGADPVAKDGEDELRRGFARGDLKFMLEGSKLQGEFAIVRLKKAESNTWLLLKKRDRHATRDDVTARDRSVRSGKTMQEIADSALEEGKVWLPKKTLSVHDGTKPVTLSPRATALATDLANWQRAEAIPEGRGVVAHALYEGYRVLITTGAGETRLTSMTKRDLTSRFPQLVHSIPNDREVTLDGLIVPLDAAGGARPLGRVTGKGESRYAYFAYDLLSLDGKDLRAKSLGTRLKHLRNLAAERLGLRLPPAVKSNSPLPPGATGILARSGEDCFVIAGGSAGSVTRALGGKARAPTAVPARAAAAHIVSTPVPAPMHPGSRYEVLRKSAPRATALTPRMTNLEKIFWPEEGLCKGDVIAYYRDVATLLLPHLKDRPESLNRHPNGVHGQSFFQKEVAGHTPGWIATATLMSGRRGKTITYLLCQDEPSLLYLANLGCIELNPWLSRVQTLNEPDFVVVDLDPDQVPFPVVIEAAITVRRILESADIPSFCKTSGSRGLHIYIPIEPVSSYDESRVFAELVCREVHRRLPHTTSVERPPERRRGLIYLDYLQNRIGQTMASVYSVRPKPLATVSAPLRWTEVKKGLSMADFTIQTMRRRLDKVGDLWPGPDGAKIRLTAAHERLEQVLNRLKS